MTGHHTPARDLAATQLLLFAPGAPGEEYVELLAEVGMTGRTLSAEEWAEFSLRHDTYWR